MAETVADVGEFGLIHRLHRVLREGGARTEGLTLGIGDDTAAFRPRPGFEVLVTCDSLVEGRHYLPELTTFEALGRRAMAVNLSDIGAMGGTPLYALVSLGLRPETRVADLEALYRGFLRELNPFGASVVGGNLTKASGGMFIDVTVLGEVEAGAAVRRSGARPGDAILVTGYPGQAAAGLQLLLASAEPRALLDHPLARAYNQPEHRAAEGRAAARTGALTAMLDTSDGLLGDLGHVCEESAVGAELRAERLPVSPELRRAAAELGREPLDWILGESDDYELLLFCRPEGVERVRAAVAAVKSLPVTEIGRVVEAERGLSLLLPGGERRPLAPAGWDHFSKKEAPHG